MHIKKFFAAQVFLLPEWSFASYEGHHQVPHGNQKFNYAAFKPLS
jgi:hypothetical protein